MLKNRGDKTFIKQYLVIKWEILSKSGSIWNSISFPSLYFVLGLKIVWPSQPDRCKTNINSNLVTCFPPLQSVSSFYLEFASSSSDIFFHHDLPFWSLRFWFLDMHLSSFIPHVHIHSQDSWLWWTHFLVTGASPSHLLKDYLHTQEANDPSIPEHKDFSHNNWGFESLT